MPIGHYCRRDPQTGDPEETLQEAAKRMAAGAVGCLVVVDRERQPVGVVTDRDVALEVVRRRVDPATTPLSAILREPAVTVTEGASIAVAIRFMRQHGVRRIPVVDAESGALTGIVTIDDLLQLVSSELSAAAEIARSQFPADLRGTHALAPGAEGS